MKPGNEWHGHMYKYLECIELQKEPGATINPHKLRDSLQHCSAVLPLINMASCGLKDSESVGLQRMRRAKDDNGMFTEEEIRHVKTLQDLFATQLQRRIGANLKRIRNEKGITQTEIWQRTGMTKTFMSILENQHVEEIRTTSIAKCQQLADVFEMPLVELVNELLLPTEAEAPNGFSKVSIRDYASTDGIACYPQNIIADVFSEELEGIVPVFDVPRIYEVLGNLSVEEQFILMKRYRDGKLLREAGKMLGITGEWVRRLQKSAVQKIREKGVSTFVCTPISEYERVLKENREMKERFWRLERIALSHID